MKLLFDQNISPRLVDRLGEVFPGSIHVQSVGLDSSSDEIVWEFAKKNGFSIVTKDEDFDALGVIRGTPPKVLWLQIGNCTTTEIELLLRSQFETINVFAGDPDLGTLVLNR